MRWVSLPDMDMALESVSHQQLLRTVGVLVEQKEVMDAVRPLINEDLSVVFYELTTIRAEGLSEQADDIRQSGTSKEALIARQFMLGLVQTADDFPLYHELFPGSTAEVGTLKASLIKVLERFPIKRVIAVADRGLLSLDKLKRLRKIVPPSGAPLEFVLAVPGRRYNEFEDLLASFHQQVQHHRCG